MTLSDLFEFQVLTDGTKLKNNVTMQIFYLRVHYKNMKCTQPANLQLLRVVSETALIL